MPVLLLEICTLEKLKNLFPGLNAAFVDVGFEKDAFLHYTDLSPYAKSILKFTQLSDQRQIRSMVLIFQSLK